MAREYTRYLDVRSQIQDGDVLLYRGKTLVGRFIRWVTKAYYSHVGIAVWWNERLMVMEAVKRGIIVVPFSKSVVEYQGGIDLFQSVAEISAQDREKMILYGQKKLGNDYSTFKMLLFGLGTFFHFPFDTKDLPKNADTFFCSHYVAQIYNTVGIDLKENLADRFMSPKDVARSPQLRYQWTFKQS